MHAGGIVKSGADIFSKTPKKGVHFPKGGLNTAPGNYMEHNVNGRLFYQEIGEDFWWDSKDKNYKIDPATLEPVGETVAVEAKAQASEVITEKDVVRQLKETIEDLQRQLESKHQSTTKDAIEPEVSSIEPVSETTSPDKEAMKQKLMGMNYHDLRKEYEIPQERMMKKEELVEKILEKLEN
jgi:Mor family transcriptional regulator